jgi:hypothetical protein
MENKQGAVEWLIKTYQQTGKIDIFDLEVANEIFKEQIIETWKHGNLPTFLGRVLTAEEYYKETYGE